MGRGLSRQDRDIQEALSALRVVIHDVQHRTLLGRIPRRHRLLRLRPIAEGAQPRMEGVPHAVMSALDPAANAAAHGVAAVVRRASRRAALPRAGGHVLAGGHLARHRRSGVEAQSQGHADHVVRHRDFAFRRIQKGPGLRARAALEAAPVLNRRLPVNQGLQVFVDRPLQFPLLLRRRPL